MQQVYNADGTPAAPQGQGYTLNSRTVILQGTTSYTVPTGTRAILVECFGAGASGGGGGNTAASASCGSGGGGGAYSAKFITGPVLTAITVSVGAGGTAPSAGNNPGNAGNDTTFDTGPAVRAKGGSAGGAGGAGGTTPLFVVGGAGGLASSGIGDVLFDGNGGGESYVASGTVGASGMGANGPWGGGALAKLTQGAGVAGGQYGAGGSGGCTLNGGGTTAGGAGGNGLIIVTEFA